MTVPSRNRLQLNEMIVTIITSVTTNFSNTDSVPKPSSMNITNLKTTRTTRAIMSLIRVNTYEEHREILTTPIRKLLPTLSKTASIIPVTKSRARKGTKPPNSLYCRPLPSALCPDPTVTLLVAGRGSWPSVHFNKVSRGRVILFTRVGT